MTAQITFAFLSIFIAICGYIPYYKDIFAGKTKPHRFTFFVWSLLTCISFFGQIAENAGPGAWVMGIVSLSCFFVFLLSFKYGTKNIVFVDWIALGGALISLILWVITKTPTYSAILITLTDVLALIPTIRKSISKPFQETAKSYFFSGLQFSLSYFALSTITIATALYPTALIIINWTFVIMLLIRRKQLNRV